MTEVVSGTAGEELGLVLRRVVVMQQKAFVVRLYELL